MNFEELDMFGIRIGLRYKHKEQYQTKFGTIISIFIYGFIVAQAFIVCKDLFEKKNPEVIFSERYVASAEKYQMGIKNFNMAFGVQNGNTSAHFIDESIYRVRAEQITIRKQLNLQTNTYEQVYDNKPVNLSPCKEDNFQVESTKDYFKNLAGVNQMYCIDQESVDIHMVGDFNSDEYSYFKLWFTICDETKNQGCQKIDKVQAALQGSFVALYSNDIIIDPKQQYPFDKVFKDFYWNSSPKIAKEITLNYRNIYVQSDNGILFEDKSLDREVAFSYQNEQVKFYQNSLFLSNQ